MDTKKHPEGPIVPSVAESGVPGFHHGQEGDVPLAAMELDRDERTRVNTGTGDQPGNTGGDRFATPTTPLEEHGDANDANKEVARRFVREIFEQGREEAVDELLTPDFKSHTWGTSGAGPQALKDAMQRISAGLTDVHMTVEDVIADGDEVGVRLTASAVQSGPFMGLPASGKRYSIGEMHIFRLRDGRVAEHWHNADMLGLMQQLGALPAKAKA